MHLQSNSKGFPYWVFLLFWVWAFVNTNTSPINAIYMNSRLLLLTQKLTLTGPCTKKTSFKVLLFVVLLWPPCGHVLLTNRLYNYCVTKLLSSQVVLLTWSSLDSAGLHRTKDSTNRITLGSNLPQLHDSIVSQFGQKIAQWFKKKVFSPCYLLHYVLIWIHSHVGRYWMLKCHKQIFLFMREYWLCRWGFQTLNTHKAICPSDMF